MINQFMNLTLNILDVDNKTFSGNYQLSQYGGKELDRENGLDWLDSQARIYDFIIGRTPTIDPHNFNLYKISHYGSKFAIIKDFLIDKNKGFSWKYF